MRQNSESFLLEVSPLRRPICAVGNCQAIQLGVVGFQGCDEVANRRGQADAADFVHKPVEFWDLFESVRCHLVETVVDLDKDARIRF